MKEVKHMKVKRFLLDGMKEAKRQIFGAPKRKPRVFKYTLVLSEPMKPSQLIKELKPTGISAHLLSIEDGSKMRYGYGFKYIITRKWEK
jgi:hypothetical protein